MQVHYYSPSTNGFYPEDLHSLYKSSGTLPEDLLEITEAEWLEFGIGVTPVGYVRGFIDGKLSWLLNEPSITLSTSSERVWRDRELTRTDIEIFKIQDQDKRALGTFEEWKDYRRKLRAWPEDGNFPNQDFRPLAPDRSSI